MILIYIIPFIYWSDASFDSLPAWAYLPSKTKPVDLLGAYVPDIGVSYTGILLYAIIKVLDLYFYIALWNKKSFL